MMSSEERLMRSFVGSALGTFVGDALGMPFEGLSFEAVKLRRKQVGQMTGGRLSRGSYTDDTEMMIGILEGLAANGEFDPVRTAQNFVNNFNPERGYGARIYGIIERLRSGASWTETGTDSFGNGSAMRVAPIGLFFFDDPEQIVRAATLSSRITHHHPEAIAGAVSQALAMGKAVCWSLRGRPLEPGLFIDGIVPTIESINTAFSLQLRQLQKVESTRKQDLIRTLRSLFQCNVKAIESVPAALGAFLFTRTFQEAVTAAISLGGDTDTIGAMAGALAGGYYGSEAIPRDWLEALDNKHKGRDYIISLAKQLARKVLDRLPYQG